MIDESLFTQFVAVRGQALLRLAWLLTADGAAAEDLVQDALTRVGTAVRLSVQAALARLTLRQRTVLVLRFYEDLTEAETAGAMNCSLGTVKSQTSHALGRLRELSPELQTVLAEGVAR